MKPLLLLPVVLWLSACVLVPDYFSTGFSPHTKVERGIAAFNTANYPEALKYLAEPAENGDMDAQYMVGMIYLYGLAGVKNSYTAQKWLTLAAQSGQRAAQEQLAFFYQDDLTPLYNPIDSYYWFSVIIGDHPEYREKCRIWNGLCAAADYCQQRKACPDRSKNVTRALIIILCFRCVDDVSFPCFFQKNVPALVVCMIIGAVLSLLLRFEIYYDLLHYHYYNGFAFVHNRLEIDVAPANIHTFFNPLLDAIGWFLIKYLNNFPNIYLAITGCVFGILLFICMKIYFLFFQNKFAVAAALVLGTTGFATWFQIGTSTNEIPVAVLVLAALYFMLKGEKEFCAAFLLGAAAGLKLTAATYCLSSGIAFLLFNFRNPKRVALFALCGIGGFLAADGFWAWRLFKLYQNPFFPFLNGFFHSPYFADINFSMQTFEAPQIDKSFISLIFLPLLLISVTKGAEPTLDHLNFSDFRWFLACVLLIIWIFKAHKTPLSRREKFLIVWLILSWLIWFKAFLVLRYLIPVEMTLPVFFVKAAISLKPSEGSVLKQAVKISLCFFVFLFASGQHGIPITGAGGQNRHCYPRFLAR